MSIFLKLFHSSVQGYLMASDYGKPKLRLGRTGLSNGGLLGGLVDVVTSVATCSGW